MRKTQIEIFRYRRITVVDTFRSQMQAPVLAKFIDVDATDKDDKKTSSRTRTTENQNPVRLRHLLKSAGWKLKRLVTRDRQ